MTRWEALAPRARRKATRVVLGPRARRKFTRVASDPRAKWRVARGWLVHLFDGPHAFKGYLEQASSWSLQTLSGLHGPLEGSGLEPPFHWTFGFTFSVGRNPHAISCRPWTRTSRTWSWPRWRCTSVMRAPF
jgi:hypothetical protein